ncbi:MAG: M14-type cytosolic carboxypeptidase [Sphingomonadaceae bacterium]|uniref:M14 family metallopeptidase n=1 Tax=Thermaurantiacus sp. TaxID=2820283 RepID=UPI00298F1012|nr:M14-type cytosolic carboxypeptidase [Thermaurantiacus sp.]MCS6985972.1 M14-type cytosolic carboxypeptidase [Sphingomonadaceae bacterium]MDW8414812.1 M14-type cytosolic carboxypeptidase [Thermaurantiacus sp.]
MPSTIDSAFDSGNVRVVRQEGPFDWVLGIRRDAGGEFFQWFHFRLSGACGVPVRLRLVGLNHSAYPDGWPGYAARVSEDRRHWRAAPTWFDPSTDDGTLEIRVTPASDQLWCAYFAPFSLERHHDLVARVALEPGVASRVLGLSLDGRSIDVVEMGEGRRHLWFLARQHPGETMAEWWMEGALEALVDPAFAPARLLRRAFRLHLVPNMNPDGAFRGHLRTNAAGANLNREWAAPSAQRSPEVLAVLEAMDRTGVSFALDVHGDEALPHVFLAGFEGVAGIAPQQLKRLEAFRQVLAAFAPEFQTRHGYPVLQPGQAHMGMATNQLAHRFGCVAATLEMPFKDSLEFPDPSTGWSPERCKALARSCLAALAAVAHDLP